MIKYHIDVIESGNVNNIWVKIYSLLWRRMANEEQHELQLATWNFIKFHSLGFERFMSLRHSITRY